MKKHRWSWGLLVVVGAVVVASHALADEDDGALIGYQPLIAQSGGLPVPAGPPSTPPPGSSQPTAYDYTTWMVGEGPYTLGRDDVVQIDVRNQPLFSGSFVVGPDGSIQYHSLGDVPVAGRTKYEVQHILATLLERYIRMPAVNVSIMAYNSKAVYVVGEVGRPGRYIMRGDVIKLREAIIAAGLPTEYAALWRVHIIKPSLEAPQVRTINLKNILYRGKLKDDINLYPGEIVVVPSTVLASVSRFLSQLLNPFARTAVAARRVGL